MTMNPVALIGVPGLPYLLGTFDTTNFRQWWRSAPFPVDVETVKKGFHIYGRTHLAIAKLTNGLWVILRSIDYGVNWTVAWTAANGEVIYDLVLINYGWAVMNTSTGFYETDNAGADWTKISSLPGASATPAICNIGGGDVLLITDGRYIWRSTDIARHWTLVCDMSSLRHYSANCNESAYYTGTSKPCIAGANGRVFAAHGPFLVQSDDSGVHWNAHVQYWEDYPFPAQAFLFPPSKIVWYRIWSMSRPQFIISEIAISSVDGPATDDVVFLFKANDLNPAPGETDLFSRVYQTFSYGLVKNMYFKAIFQQYLTPDTTVQQLSSFNVPVLGANYMDRLIFSAQTKTVNGVSVPSLKYSRDGGLNWVDVDISKIQIGDPSGGLPIDGSILEDNFAKMTWVAPPCNNSGHYVAEEYYRVQCQSYELDTNIIHAVSILDSFQYFLDANISTKKTSTDSIDAIVEKSGIVSQLIDAFLEKTKTLAYHIDRILEGDVTLDDSVDAIVSIDHGIEYENDVILWDDKTKSYVISAYLGDEISKPYSVDVIISKNSLTDRLRRLDRINPQMFDLYLTDSPLSPMDSRRDK